MSDALSAFLSAHGRARWSWGQVDCVLVPAAWWIEQTGQDPARAFRDRYHDQRGARRAMAERGGIVACVGDGLTSAGARLTVTPARGDVGLVTIPYFVRRGRAVSGPAGAICLAPGLWCVRQRAGLMAAAFPLIKAWTSQHG